MHVSSSFPCPACSEPVGCGPQACHGGLFFVQFWEEPEPSGVGWGGKGRSTSFSGFSMRQKGFPVRNRGGISQGQWGEMVETEPVISLKTMLVPCSAGWQKRKKKVCRHVLLDQRVVFMYVIITRGYKNPLGRNEGQGVGRGRDRQKGPQRSLNSLMAKLWDLTIDGT